MERPRNRLSWHRAIDEADTLTAFRAITAIAAAVALVWLRAAAPSLPVLITSGYSSEEEALARGAAGFIAKPFLPRELVQTVAHALERAPHSPPPAPA